MTEDGIQVSPTTVKERLDRGEDVFLLDVREPNEAQIATIQEATLIPMNDVPRRLDEIPRDKDVVVYCRSGVRSMQVTQFLQGQGFERVKNLQGGIHAWIDQVDPSQPKY